MFDLKLFCLVWGTVALFTGWYVLLIMAIVYGGALFIGALPHIITYFMSR